LLDTGDGRDEYIPVLESALNGARADGAGISDEIPDISSIVLSHRHHDHVDGLPSVLASLRRLWERRTPSATYIPPRVYKFPLPSTDPDTHVREVLSKLAPGSTTPTLNKAPVHDLKDGEVIPLDSSDEVSLEVIHTPGHTSDSICLLLRNRQDSQASAIFTADTLLGGSTSVFEHLSAYLASLRHLRSLIPKERHDYILYPGHGDVVKDGAKALDMYITHRMQRETAIIGVLSDVKNEHKDRKSWTPMQIVETLYWNVPQDMWKVAERGVVLHLQKLEEDGVVRQVSSEIGGSMWEKVES
jgi:ribonuclease/clavin/mitogillin